MCVYAAVGSARCAAKCWMQYKNANAEVEAEEWLRRGFRGRSCGFARRMTLEIGLDDG